MGRTRLPLSEQKGNLTKKQQGKRQAEQDIVTTGDEYFKKPPKWLTDPVAVAEYKRLVKAMKNMEMIGDLDANNLAGYCNAFAKYHAATGELDGSDLVVEGKENPLIAIQIKYAKEMRDFARLCGLSIDSRLKFAAVKLEVIENDISEEFGDI